MNIVLAFHRSDEEAGKAHIADELAKLAREEGLVPGPVSFAVRQISEDAVLVRGSTGATGTDARRRVG